MSIAAEPAGSPAALAGVAASAEKLQARRRLVLVSLGASVALAVLCALALGPFPLGPTRILQALLAMVGLGTDPIPAVDQTVVATIRLPRAVLGLTAGAALAGSGAALQGLLRNPLADTALLGVSAGGALGAVLVIFLGDIWAAVLPATALPYLMPVAAFTGALLVTALVYRLASGSGYTDVGTLLLAGIAINSMVSALIGIFVFASDDRELRDLSFWMLGSLGGASWQTLLPTAGLVVPALAMLLRAAPALNALLLGEADAAHLGVELEQVKRRLLAGTALAAGATVAVTGIIGFVGLVVPHLVRMMGGAEHRTLLPAAMLLGAALLVLADTLARTLVVPAELPIGILTSCAGGPFFLWLLLRQRRAVRC